MVEPLLLGIPNIARYDFIERQAMATRLELLAEYIGLDSELAAHSILHRQKLGVDRIECKGTHGSVEESRWWS
jgi:hypothetical protein